jgi:hypothetical protein
MIEGRTLRILALAWIIFTALGCSMVEEPRALNDEEQEGLERILEVVDIWARETQEGAEIGRVLREAQADNRFHRAQVRGPTILGVTSGDEIFLAPQAPLETRRHERLFDALIALNIVVHEGAHLLQSEEFRALGLPETEAYHRAHEFDRWLLGAWIDGNPKVRAFLAAPDLASLSAPLLRSRRATGGGFLDEVAPVHLLRRSFDEFRKERGRGLKPFDGHARRRWELRRDCVRTSENHHGLLPAPNTKAPTTLNVVLAEEPESFPERLRLSHPDGRPRFEAGWLLVRDLATGEDRTDEWQDAAPRLVLDERLPGTPLLRIEAPPGRALPLGDFEIIWLPQQLLSVSLAS